MLIDFFKLKGRALGIKFFVILVYVGNFLITKVEGFLVISIVLYFSASNVGLSEPYSMQELVLWLDGLSDSFKAAIFTSLLTILGFLIAFNVGASTQRKQFLYKMNLDSSSELEEFFDEAGRKTTDASIYAKSILNTIGTIHVGSPREIVFNIEYLRELTREFLVLKERLSIMTVEAHRFGGKHGVLFASSWRIHSQLNGAVEAFTNITDKMWFKTPIYDSNELTEDLFLSHVDIDECCAFLKAYNENYNKMSGLIGSIRGELVSPITGMNLPLIVNVLKMRL